MTLRTNANPGGGCVPQIGQDTAADRVAFRVMMQLVLPSTYIKYLSFHARIFKGLKKGPISQKARNNILFLWPDVKLGLCSTSKNLE